jgi:hypothetical protein
MLGRNCSDKAPMERRKGIRGNEQAAVRLPREHCDLILYLVRPLYEGSDWLDLEFRGSIGEYSKIILGEVSGFTMNPTRESVGAISFRTPSHLPTIDGSKKTNPVMLPPGRAKLST